MKLRKDLLCTLIAVAVVLLCFVALPQTAQATGASQPVEVTVSASPSTMCWGKEITVTVSIEEVNNCWVGGFLFGYDKDVFEYVHGEALVSNFAASGVSDANGEIAGYFMDETTKAKNIEGDLFQITLKVKEGAAAGNYEISGQATFVTVSGDVGETLTCKVTAKIVTVGHDWNPATCTAAKTCKICGETEGKLAAHTWTETTAAVSATCEAAGKTAVKTCSVCKKAEGGEEIAALGHDMRLTGLANAPTCDSPGNTAQMTCFHYCGLVTGNEEIPALGHSMVETTAAVAATCETAGKTAILTCAHNCGATEGGEEIPATGHRFEDGVCSACGQTDYIAGDVDGSEEVTQDDVVYLLLHTLFGEEEYPMNDAPADIDGNGLVEERDVVYLLLHTLFDESYYPLKREEI